MKAKNKYADGFVTRTLNDKASLGDREKKLVDIFSEHKFGRILDIGCGDGNFSVLLKEASGAEEVYGVEISGEALETARRNGIRAFRVNVDNDSLPFEDESFDVVFAGEIIEHLFDLDHFLDESYRVLRRGGAFLISTPNLASFVNRVALFLGFYPYPINISLKHSVGHVVETLWDKPENELFVQGADHIHVPTLRSLKELLKIHNFEISDVKGFSPSLPKNIYFKTFVLFTYKVFNRIPSLSHGVIVLCRKKGT